MQKLALALAVLVATAFWAAGCGGHRMQVGQPVPMLDADAVGRQAGQVGAAQIGCSEDSVTVTLLGASMYRVAGCGRANDYLCGTQPGRWHREVLCSLQAASAPPTP